MFEFVRYTFLVLLGLACIVTLFISIAITGAVVTQNGGLESAHSANAIYWSWGIMAFAACFWIFGRFLLRVPLTILYWLQDYREHITAYALIGLICFIFVIT